MPAGQNHSNFALNTRLSAPRYDTWCKIQVINRFGILCNSALNKRSCKKTLTKNVPRLAFYKKSINLIKYDGYDRKIEIAYHGLYRFGNLQWTIQRKNVSFLFTVE
jgi:hypothetical protein